jgi:nitrate reductase assembly molybdenum cofactor insertion protein NarJ
MPSARYEVLATLVGYPGPGFDLEVARAIALHAADYPGAARRLAEFRQLLPADDLTALRELHTRTFEVQAITSLDIGYTLFGEDYKRGALLANLSREHAAAGIDCGGELGDHLGNVLRLLTKLADSALRQELVRVLVAPALQQMIREFDPAPLAKKEALYQKHHKTIIEAAPGETRTAYRHLLEAILEILRHDFALKPQLPVIEESVFAGAVDTEMGIESCAGCGSPNGGVR